METAGKAAAVSFRNACRLAAFPARKVLHFDTSPLIIFSCPSGFASAPPRIRHGRRVRRACVRREVFGKNRQDQPRGNRNLSRPVAARAQFFRIDAQSFARRSRRHRSRRAGALRQPLGSGAIGTFAPGSHGWRAVPRFRASGRIARNAARVRSRPRQDAGARRRLRGAQRPAVSLDSAACARRRPAAGLDCHSDARHHGGAQGAGAPHTGRTLGVAGHADGGGCARNQESAQFAAATRPFAAQRPEARGAPSGGKRPGPGRALGGDSAGGDRPPDARRGRFSQRGPAHQARLRPSWRQRHHPAHRRRDGA
ncbi:MAG: hypothetical protein BWZ10_01454 [candidate division BRC1 bacterium ADurb.BinA364]|nr:MAG: hypothetical protein BWZ10_01454 [candidate division BRC1 bacterium ADurb.BinA364]